jgi:mRNA interferase MazF
MVNRFDLYLVSLDPEPSADAKNTRPCIVISPDELNRNLDTVIIAPISSTAAVYPTRLLVEFLNSQRYVILDQIRTVDKSRMTKKVGSVDEADRRAILETLSEMFAE